MTIDLNISYIKNAPAGSALTVTGQVVSGGKKIMRAEGRIYHGRQLLCRAQASYYVTGDFHERGHRLKAAGKKAARHLIE